jgi:hypothetical protein
MKASSRSFDGRQARSRNGRNPSTQASRKSTRLSTARSERGQATVEMALTLPLVVALLLVMAEVALAIRNQLYVINLAREAARHAAVDEPIGPVPSQVSVQLSNSGNNVVAVVTIRHKVTTPLLSRIGPFDLTAQAVMRSERL